MAPRHLGCRWVAVLVISVLAACKGDEAPAGDKPAATTTDLPKRCERLAKLCGDKAKHVSKITEECLEATKQQACLDKTLALYDCLEKELCMVLPDKVWALEDLGVLADRHKKCAPERSAVTTCTKK